MDRKVSGIIAGSLVYSADSPVISRVFRYLQQIHPLFACSSGTANSPSPVSSPARWGHPGVRPKRLGCYGRWCICVQCSPRIQIECGSILNNDRYIGPHFSACFSTLPSATRRSALRSGTSSSLLAKDKSPTRPLCEMKSIPAMKTRPCPDEFRCGDYPTM